VAEAGRRRAFGVELPVPSIRLGGQKGLRVVFMDTDIELEEDNSDLVNGKRD